MVRFAMVPWLAHGRPINIRRDEPLTRHTRPWDSLVDAYFYVRITRVFRVASVPTVISLSEFLPLHAFRIKRKQSSTA